MPEPTRLPTDLSAGSRGHLRHTRVVHAAINALTLVRHSTVRGRHVFALDDSAEVVEFDCAGPVEAVVPSHASVRFPVGTVIMVCQYGPGAVTLRPATGVVLRTSSSLTTRARYSEVSLRQRSINEWLVSGDLA